MVNSKSSDYLYFKVFSLGYWNDIFVNGQIRSLLTTYVLDKIV